MQPRIGMLGVGHFGRFHAVKLAAKGCLSALHDASPARAAEVAGELGVRALDAAGVIAASDAVLVTAPTAYHHALGLSVLRAGRHLFVEKPMAATMAEAGELAAEARSRGLVLQVGHIERYSAALRAVKAAAAERQPLVLEATRVAPFRPRSLDVSVVMDLMVHDLDLVLDLAGSALMEVRASGARVMSDRLDFAVAQLGFANGARATITASRVSIGMERRLRLLSAEGEMRVDFLSRSLETLRPGGTEALAAMPGWGIDRASWTDHDSLEAEHAAFIASIVHGAAVEADAAVGLRALDVALRVEQAAFAAAR